MCVCVIVLPSIPQNLQHYSGSCIQLCCKEKDIGSLFSTAREQITLSSVIAAVLLFQFLAVILKSNEYIWVNIENMADI